MQLTNWGNYPCIETRFAEPDSIDTAAVCLAGVKSTIGRGLGRCYGDSALNGELVTSALRLNHMLSFDEETGVLVAEAGVSLAEIIDAFVIRGWFPPVTPGTKFVTLGGAVASDVHGKNHHVSQTFGQHVLWFDIITACNGIVRCSFSENPDLFHATCGGHGLTGLIVKVALQLVRIPGAWIRQRGVKKKNLAEIMDTFEGPASDSFSVAWIDCLKGGDGMGRSILMCGDFAHPEKLPSPKQAAPYTVPAPRNLTVPFNFPSFALNPLSVRIFNALYYSKAPAGTSSSLVSYNTFFYPLDAVHHWNRIYGKRGFTQYQFVIPREAAREGLPKILKEIAGSGQGSFLAVLKLFGRQNTFPGNISFPLEGYTLALDFPVSARLFPLLEKLDSMVLDYGGRHYLTKDARIRAATFREGYGKALDEFLEVKARWDPDNVFTSVQAQRLGLGV